MNTDIRNRLIFILGILLLAIVFLLPTLFSALTAANIVSSNPMPKNWISKPISLGLDLSGGVHLVYEVQTKEAVKSHLQNVGNSIRADLRKDKIAVTKVKPNEKDQLELTLLSDRGYEQAKKSIEDNYRKQVTFIERRDEDGKVKLVYGLSPKQIEEIEARSVTQAAETLRTRVDQFGVAEPLIQSAGEKRIILQMPGVQDIESVKRVVGSVAKLEFRLVPMPGSSVGTVTLKNRDGGQITLEDEVLMTGDAVETASVALPEGQFEVMLALTADGTKLFRKITTDNVHRNLAIILDGVVYSSPTIREPIPNGHASISGSFTQNEAKELSVVLRSGALPAPLKVLEERTVGPSLGKESIKSGVMAIAMGFIFIFAFMVIYYKKSGVVAVFTLAFHLLIVLACLSAFGATMTLPGLAGLALTTGMAVDSNVLIFERIREEIQKGSGRDAGIIAGFQHALSAVIDSNITTLLTGFVLYFLGTGAIKGYAVTLTIGIATTIFCATTAARIWFDILPLRAKNQELSI